MKSHTSAHIPYGSQGHGSSGGNNRSVTPNIFLGPQSSLSELFSIRKKAQAEPNGESTFVMRGGTTTAGHGGNGDNGTGGDGGYIASLNKSTNQIYIDNNLTAGSGGDAKHAYDRLDSCASSSAQVTGGHGGSLFSSNENVTLEVQGTNLTAGNGGGGTSERGKGGAGGNIGVGNS